MLVEWKTIRLLWPEVVLVAAATAIFVAGAFTRSRAWWALVGDRCRIVGAAVVLGQSRLAAGQRDSIADRAGDDRPDEPRPALAGAARGPGLHADRRRAWPIQNWPASIFGCLMLVVGRRDAHRVGQRAGAAVPGPGADLDPDLRAAVPRPPRPGVGRSDDEVLLPEHPLVGAAALRLQLPVRPRQDDAHRRHGRSAGHSRGAGRVAGRPIRSRRSPRWRWCWSSPAWASSWRSRRCSSTPPTSIKARPTPTPACLAVAPKIAGVAALVRLVVVAMPAAAEFAWQLALILAVLTMTIGNVCALWQRQHPPADGLFVDRPRRLPADRPGRRGRGQLPRRKARIAAASRPCCSMCWSMPWRRWARLRPWPISARRAAR